MKPIQIMMDEQLLARLDADDEVKHDGRSAVMRRAVEDYLRRRRSTRIADSYRRAYGDGGGLGADWSGWEDEGQWPEP
jgi:metal-responsive CopG/Arc/MetJ family transcriptional regulator